MPVVVIGGGPIGALSALYAARRGYHVELYELRDDPNYGDPNARPDIAVIPLTLSERGIRAILGAGVPGLLDEILAGSQPVYTRMVHTKDATGNLKNISMVYGPHGECLHTLPREKITKHVMLALQKEPTAKLFFNHKLSTCDFEKKLVTFDSVMWKAQSKQELAQDDLPIPSILVTTAATPAEQHESLQSKPVSTSTKRTVEFDFLIGADGTYSTVRQGMMRKLHMDFSQQYLGALWCDFNFPPAPDGDYRMDPTGIHIWPADQNIVICQPDSDRSFRAGMVCTASKVRYFEAHPTEFTAWFEREFPGIIGPLLTADEALRQFIAHQKIPLKSMKCGKLGYKDSVVLLGDSSHSMTPFQAMGMGTGLEDVRIFFEQFRDPQMSVAGGVGAARPFCAPGTIDAYTEFRLPDVHAMVDMAAAHYLELRFGVRSPMARAKKIVEACLSRWMPWLGWTTAYARIQFGHDRFSVVREKEARQKAVIKTVLAGTTGFLVSAALTISFMVFRTQVIDRAVLSQCGSTRI